MTPRAAIEQTVDRLVERVERRHFGKYRGVVTNVDDPNKSGRIRARVPQLLGDVESGWALPCVPYAGDQEGLFAVPKVGSAVWIEFEGGDLAYPVWAGAFWADGEVPESAPPTTKVLKTTAGHKLVADDQGGSLVLADGNGNGVTLDSSGIKLADANGNGVTLDSSGIKLADANGNSLTLDSSGITLGAGGGAVSVGQGAGDNLVAFNALQAALQTFLGLLAGHTHVCSAPGSPGGPPVPPPQLELTPARSHHKVAP